MLYTYKDPYLTKLITQVNEDDAVASIKTYGTFSSSQMDTLVPLRAYVLTCIDNVKAPDDVFSTKKKFYESEFKTALEVARVKTPTGVTQSLFSISLERA